MANLYKKCSANKALTGKETMPCSFCDIDTQYILTLKDGGECWACESCLWKEGGLKRFKLRMGKYSTLKKKAISGTNSRVKIEKRAMLGGGVS